ncbi:uncharacterized protein BDZ99DRAFT_138105 [Mytilinidion resinicola]|uniref:Uncharacterized protein n=1 Tax=Mytilinidion resinicola TaxID=574789 RepID=A0A6A6Z736_9PEZI|nr:uncharacterized protein BDZ99DRAFT_138105 [Mytilinidion resinicola]KAF2816519.1 hypothetical protein BDZ99DRAFT_138105 [Mytilinidion resinicola]
MSRQHSCPRRHLLSWPAPSEQARFKMTPSRRHERPTSTPAWRNSPSPQRPESLSIPSPSYLGPKDPGLCQEQARGLLLLLQLLSAHLRHLSSPSITTRSLLSPLPPALHSKPSCSLHPPARLHAPETPG